MLDKSMTLFITMLLVIGGIVILILAWLEPMSVPERIGISIVGIAGIITVFIRFLMTQAREAKVHIAHTPDKTDIKKNNDIAK